ncbi:TRAFAC clade GTPase domain-containing protein [Desulfosarcina ovata]|uniref:Double-GTPase 2 domain-containing protein n=1 Tax=Desulfosarcina ovata subsp. ovata TaxID=2752305 RepID=A0A5K8A6N8_9BACT|nr:hypothetical protein [Desulfosarcina ovata]BBO88034.1 hypothetical protein DSCOOX_12140 [Desulfosarcina ovata subsp. ovata]
MTDTENEITDEVPEWISLHTGDALNGDGLENIGAAHPMQVVMLLGPKRVGKTTLLAEFHNRFLCGPFAGFLFAGSLTLPGFEHRCYLSRTTSRMEKPDTRRTPLGSGVHYFHLAVRDSALNDPIRHVVIGDASGERFRTLHMNREDVLSMKPLLAAMGRTVFMVDGRHLANPVKKQQARTRARVLVRSLIETEVLGADSMIDFVISKWDYVVEHQIEDFAEAVLKEAQDSYASAVREFAIHRVSARPSIGSKLEKGFGMAGLFQAWVRPIRTPHIKLAKVPETSRSFLRNVGGQNGS